MSWPSLKACLSRAWEKLNREWARGGEIQTEIEKAKAEHAFKYGNVRWHL